MAHIVHPRLPFADAIADPRLLKTAWDTFSDEQKTVMKAIYGLRLNEFELATWHALHGGGRYDDLYNLIGVDDSGVPYHEGVEYNDVTLVIGRRAAKSCIGSFVCVYELLCGGHKQYLKLQNQQPYFLQIAQDLEMAQKIMREYTLTYLQMSPFGLQELAEGTGKPLGDLTDSVTQKQIVLKNCGIVRVGPPNMRVGRGGSVPYANMDELASWSRDDRSANPDHEVEKAIVHAQGQFPHRKRLKFTTPMTETGLAWEAVRIGTRGRFLTDPIKLVGNKLRLVMQGPSPVLRNPSITRDYLVEERAKDPLGFHREIGAQFAKSVSGLLPPDLIDAAISVGVTERPYRSGVNYIACADPAFRNDAFTLSIGHLEGEREFVQDLLMSWRGTRKEPLNAAITIGMAAKICQRYGVASLVVDQHHVDSLQSLASDSDFLLEYSPSTNKSNNQMWADFLTVLSQRKAKLLDHPELRPELLGLERKLTLNKSTKISGKRDDHAVVTARCLHRALSFGLASPKANEPENEPTTASGIAIVRGKLWGSRTRAGGGASRVWWNR